MTRVGQQGAASLNKTPSTLRKLKLQTRAYGVTLRLIRDETRQTCWTTTIMSLKALTVWCYQGGSRLIILSGSRQLFFNWSAADQTLRRSSYIPLIRSNWLDRNMPGGRTVICCWCVWYKTQVKLSDRRGNYPTFLPGGFCPVPDETIQPRTTSTGPLLLQVSPNALILYFIVIFNNLWWF